MEKWKSITGYEGEYEVSNYGRVKSLSRTVNSSNGGRLLSERILKLKLTKKGYFHVMLKKKGKMQLIHRLVATSFIENTLNKPQVNHINGIKTDNNVENLEWCTQSENQIHAYKYGFQMPKGLKLAEHYKARNISVFNLKNELIANYNCIKICAKEMNLNYNSICRVLQGKRNKYHNLIFKYEQ